LFGEKGTMALWYWIGGGMAAALLIYLVVALLKPELFA
jgi:K+-transporting ATPase KdpF subunit